jgi:hypothetical protein
VKKISFGLLELEMADLERFWRKTPLGPLGVKENKFCSFLSIFFKGLGFLGGCFYSTPIF